MAVTKLWSVTERLGQVIDYATNPEKTSAKIKREFSPEQYGSIAYHGKKTSLPVRNTEISAGRWTQHGNAVWNKKD